MGVKSPNLLTFEEKVAICKEAEKRLEAYRVRIRKDLEEIMSLKLLQFKCTGCGEEFEELAYTDEEVTCPSCQAKAELSSVQNNPKHQKHASWSAFRAGE